MTNPNIIPIPANSPLNQQKPEGEMDLIIEIGNTMVRFGLRDKVELYYTSDARIRLALGKPIGIQLNFAKRYFLDQCLVLEANSEFKTSTLDLRQHLLVPGGPTVWLHHFERYVVPFLIDNNLPGPSVP